MPITMLLCQAPIVVYKTGIALTLKTLDITQKSHHVSVVRICYKCVTIGGKARGRRECRMSKEQKEASDTGFRGWRE